MAIDVLDEADGDLLALGVADDLQLQLLPAEDGFLDQDLSDEAGGQSPAGDGPQFLDVVDQRRRRCRPWCRPAG